MDGWMDGSDRIDGGFGFGRIDERRRHVVVVHQRLIESKDLSGKFDIRILARAPRTKRGPFTSSFTLTKE